MKIRYQIDFPHPSNHLAHVILRLSGLPKGKTTLVLPSWLPGSYRIRDFARHVQDFQTPEGISWKKSAKNRWEIDPAGRKTLRVEYNVFCFERLVQASHVDDSHAFLNPGNLLMYVDGRKDLPSQVSLKPLKGWKVATGLDPVKGKKHLYQVRDYDQLVDSPIEMGNFLDLSFQVRGVPHRVAIDGEGNFDSRKLLRDMKKICTAEARMMKGLPYDHYTFIVHLTENRGGGLEHCNSTALQAPRFSFRPEEKYENWLELVAHEFFHLWNVKRIRPVGLGPFDYEKEVYTPMLWVMEGTTSYYHLLFPLRAGTMSVPRFLRRLGGQIRKYDFHAGRHHQTLAESSLDAWIKLYQPNENASNSIISYYHKGQLVSMALDMEIRRATGNRASLDDVMRRMYREWGARNEAFPPGTFERVAEETAGRSLKRFFREKLEQVKEFSWNRILEPVGLCLEKERRKGTAAPEEAAERLGIRVKWVGRRPVVQAVLEDGPAWREGLGVRDEILAVDGYRAGGDSWGRLISEADPETPVRITVFREGRLREVEVTPSGELPEKFRVCRVKRPSKAQKEAFESWLWTPWS